MTITTVFDPPLPSDSPATFNTKAFALLGGLNDFATEANALAAGINVDEAALDAAVAAAAASSVSASLYATAAQTDGAAQVALATAQATAAAASASTASSHSANANSYATTSTAQATISTTKAAESAASATASANSANAAATSANEASASAATAAAIVLGTTTGHPTIRPTLNLDFANSQAVDPRVTFTRPTGAVYYDGKTFSKAEENLLLQSQTFGTTWTTSAASITSDTTVAPDGTTTADTLTADGTTNIHNVLQTVTAFAATGDKVFSVYAKAGTANYIQLNNAGTSSVYANFDLATGVVGSVGAGNTSSITSVGSGWYRCSFTTSSTVPTSVLVSIVDSASAPRSQSWATSGTVHLWGAQLEQRSTVTAYTATTTAPITRYVPKLMTAVSGQPRIDFNPTTGVCNGLLIEEARTNLLLQSEDFSNAAWSKTRITVSGDAVVSPDGVLTADKFIADTSAGTTHYINQSPTLTDNTTYCYSVFAKAAELSKVVVAIITKAGSQRGILFDLTAGTASVSSESGWTTAPTAYGIASVGNGWYRCWVAHDVGTGATTSNPRVYATSSAGLIIHTGDGTSGIYIWGAQLEAGAFPTSYIPTTTAQVTRAADVAVMTGTNFSSWYRQDVGTFVVTCTPLATSYSTAGHIVSLSDGTTSEAIAIQRNSSLASNFAITDGGVAQVSASGATMTTGATSRLAIAYKTNDSIGAYDGTLTTADTACTMPTVTQMHIGSRYDSGRYMVGYISRIAYYPARLTNAQLQALTAA